MIRVVLALWPAVALAQTPSVEASVDATSVTLADTITLQVAVEAPGGYERLDPPDLRDFYVGETGRQQQAQIFMQGGRLEQHSIETYTYTLRPRRAGELAIGPARLVAGGQTFESRPITIEVAQGGAAVPPPVSLGPPAPPTAAPSAQDESLFLQAQTDRAEVWVGEQVNVTWSLFTQADILNYRPVKEPTTDLFWSEDLYSPSLHLEFDRQIVGGRLYYVAPLRKKALFPRRDGDLVVGPLEAECVTTASRLFVSEPLRRASNELHIRVKALPTEGRPPGFAAANVGRFTLSANVDRTEVQAGEPVSLHVVVRGTGNLRSVKEPIVEGDGFKAYPPRIEDRVEVGTPVSGEKRVDYVLLPSKGGALTIPGLSLPYFDPGAGRFEVARTDPIALTVIGDPSAVAPGAAPPVPLDNVLREDIRPIHHRADLRRAPPGRPLTERWLPLWLSLPPLGYFAVVGVAMLRRRGETPSLRRRRVRRRVRAQIRLAEDRLRAGDAPGFFAEAARALAASLDHRLGRRVDGMTRDELAAALRERGGVELASDVLKELDNCDFARFAPSSARAGEMRACLERLPDLLDRLERVT